MKLSKDQSGGLCLLLFSSAYLYLTSSIPLIEGIDTNTFTARTMPLALGIIGVVVALILLTQRGGRDKQQNMNWPLALAFLVLMSAYGFTLRPLGFLASTFIFLTVGFTLLGERRITTITVTAASVTLVFWSLMNFVLGVYIAPAPEGL